jgi:hypothetical protein
MITRRLAQALIQLAARRWPEHVRTDVRREWTAEVAVLADSHRRLAMLRYAVSLATHPTPRAATPALPRIWYAVRVLLKGPALCVWLLFASQLLTTGVLDTVANYVADRSVDRSETEQRKYFLSAHDVLVTHFHPLLLSVLCLVSAYLAARAGRRWAPEIPGVPQRMVIAVVPVFAAAAVAYMVGDSGIGASSSELVITLYTVGLSAVLSGAVRLRRSGRRRAAWLLGIAGAVVVADLAVMAAVFALRLPVEEGGIAPMWLPGLMSGWDFGLPHVIAVGPFDIPDQLAGVPPILVVVTGWALGAVLRTEEAGRAQAQPA